MKIKCTKCANGTTKEALDSLEEARIELFKMAGTNEVDIKVINRVTEAIFNVTHPGY